MARPLVHYAEVRLGDGKITARLEDMSYVLRDWNRSRHTSSDYELHFLMGDGAIIHFDSGNVVVEKNHAAIIAPNRAHGAESARGTLEHFYIHFSAEGNRLKEALSRVVSESLVFPVKQDTEALIRETLRELTGNGSYRQELLNALLPLVIIKVFRDANIVVECNLDNLQDEDQERRNLIDVFFRADLPYGKSEERLAEELGLSRRQLSRVLKENYNMNFRQMLLKSRMDHAAWMLRTSDLPVSRIAEKLKYTSVSAFSQCFRAVHGVSPTEYRRQMT